MCKCCGVVQRRKKLPVVCTFNESQTQQLVEPWQHPGSLIQTDKNKTISRTSVQLFKTGMSKPKTRMYNLVKKMDTIVTNLECSERLHKRALNIMFMVLNMNTLKRIKKDELLCSVALVFAARECQIQYTFREIANACNNVERKEVCRVFKRYERVLSKTCIDMRRIDTEKVKFTPMIPRLGSYLGLDFLDQKKVRILFSKINRSSELCSLNPLTRLSVALYKVMGQSKENCERVSMACNVSTHTILKSTELIEEIFVGNDPKNAA